MKLQVVAVLGVAVLVVSSCVPSQASVDGCEHAIEVVRRGEPATREGRAWSTLPACGAAGGEAARDAWTSLRSVSDSARIASVYDRLRSFRDASLFGAARAVLLDSAATAEARVSSAMLVVAQLVEHAAPDYRVFSTAGSHDVCAIGSATDRPLRDGAPLPRDARALAESAALRVLASASAPQSVRNAARCLYDAVEEDGSVLARETPPPTVVTHTSESAGRLDTARSRSANTLLPRARPRSGRRSRQPVDSIRGVVALAGAGGCVMMPPNAEGGAGKRIGLDSLLVRGYQGTRVHDGILRRSPRGDVIETRDGRRLPVANLPRALEKADGMRVLLGEPLGAPTIAGVIDPGSRRDCTE